MITDAVYTFQLVIEQGQLQRLMTAYDVIEDIDDDIDDEIVMVLDVCLTALTCNADMSYLALPVQT